MKYIPMLVFMCVYMIIVCTGNSLQ